MNNLYGTLVHNLLEYRMIIDMFFFLILMSVVILYEDLLIKEAFFWNAKRARSHKDQSNLHNS